MYYLAYRHLIEILRYLLNMQMSLIYIQATSELVIIIYYFYHVTDYPYYVRYIMFLLNKHVKNETIITKFNILVRLNISKRWKNIIPIE